MDNGTYVSLSLATAMRNALDVTANNIANANTAGFKGERVEFDSYMLRETGTEDGRETDFLIDQGSFMDPAQGAMSRTGNPLDLALQGDGWFAYETDGGTAYGRDGRFALSPDGNLVTLNGALRSDAGFERLDWRGDVEGNGLRLGAQSDAAVVQLGRSGAGTLVAPIAQRIADILRRESRGSSFAAELSARQGPTGAPVVMPSKTPDRIRTRSGSWRWVVKRLCPGRRRSR